MAKIKRIGVIKTASFMGLFGVIIGLISALLIGLVVSIISSLFLSGINTSGSLTNTSSFYSFSWIYLVTFPILYGISGFILGLIFTPITNLVLKIIKGLDLEIELAGQKY